MSDLTLVTLPIGNLGDITIRALEALKTGQVFYAEDTRVFKELLSSLGISYQDKVIDSFHDQSIGKIQQILEKVKAGESVYLVSDAGSPIVSDPAYPLLKALTEEGIAIKTLPGPTAVITALELSALPPHPFHFWGFIGRGKSEKKDFFRELSLLNGTHIFFESPHRVYETIELFFEIFPEAVLVVARELTKTYESVYRLTKKDLSTLESIVVEKGEFVLLFHVEKLAKKVGGSHEVTELALDYIENGGGPKKLAKLLSKILGSETKEIYDRLNRASK